jgi:hypothetical protein
MMKEQDFLDVAKALSKSEVSLTIFIMQAPRPLIG